ncbi:unnamed protein product [Aureobasidium mustum]|uniref:Uncharacterized protein n=1 Tax=Aureobasidium mustum TaxID=2773714 RepID=A0A9N8PKI9_9PEZI|nr:unnamed protein product [Aureobasidium mustum]
MSTTEYLNRTDKRYKIAASDPEKATICYLVLPTQAAQWEVQLDPMCSSTDSVFGSSASSILVDRNSMSLTEDHQRRFARALLHLGLKPSVHPSQLRGALSATSTVSNSSTPSRQVPFPTTNQNVSFEEKTKRDAATTERIKGLEKSQWPKLMLLVDHNFDDLR